MERIPKHEQWMEKLAKNYKLVEVEKDSQKTKILSEQQLKIVESKE
jgi:hypothetical protein